MVYSRSAIISFAENVVLDINYGDLPEQDTYVFCGLLQSRGKYRSDNKTVTIKKFTFSVSKAKELPLAVQFYNGIVKNVYTYNQLVDMINSDLYKDVFPATDIENFVLYITLNPRNELKASNKVVKAIIDDVYIGKVPNLKELTFKALHTSSVKTQRAILDFDLHIEYYDKRETMIKFVELVLDEFGMEIKEHVRDIVITHGGYHVYVDLSTFSNKQKEQIFTGKLKEFAVNNITFDGKYVFKDVEVKTDAMIVLPGTIQGGSKVISTQFQN